MRLRRVLAPLGGAQSHGREVPAADFGGNPHRKTAGVKARDRHNAERPAVAFRHISSTWQPSGVMHPAPVMTTRLDISDSAASDSQSPVANPSIR